MNLAAGYVRRKQLKKLVGILVLVTTLFLFAYYIVKHTHILDGLSKTSALTVGVILLLYGVILYTNAYTLHWAVALCGKLMSYFETLLLSCYSSLVNFLGPLQSGPGFRAIYLKKKHDISLKAYGTATLL